MSEDIMKNHKVRLGLWGAAALLAVISFIILIFNYQALQEALSFSEKAAVSQSKNYHYYVNEYRVTKVELNDANEKIVVLGQELQQANTDLKQTRGELSSVQKVNDDLKASIVALERYKAKAAEKGEALEMMLASFKKMNKQLDADLQGVRKELSVFQPDITDINEGRAKIKMFKQHVHMVKQNIAIIRQKAFEARVAAQKEQDRLKAVYGNGGYMVKDGWDKSVTAYGKKRVDIDVKFINK